jgi:heme/copper-type cytochrome/quinol oxidase subunit 3
LRWKVRNRGTRARAYGSLYFTVTGFHVAHVVVGAVMLALLMVGVALGCFGARRHDGSSRDVLALRHRRLDFRVPHFYGTPYLM